MELSGGTAGQISKKRSLVPDLKSIKHTPHFLQTLTGRIGVCTLYQRMGEPRKQTQAVGHSTISF